jgi:peptidyl-prolyl cis-trans isomerase C
VKKIPLFFLLLLLLSSCALLPAGSPSATPTASVTAIPPTQTPIPFAISVDGSFISIEEYQGEIERYRTTLSNLGITKTDEDIATVVQDELVTQLLLANAATKAGYSLDDAALKNKIDNLTADLGSREALDAWIIENKYSEPSFLEALKRNSAATWMRNEIAAGVPKTAEQVHIRQLLLYDEATARYYFDQLQSGIEFDVLASQIEPVTRGDIGWFPRGYIPDRVIEDAAFGLEVGATSEIISGDVGFYILKCLAKLPNKELSPDAFATLQKLAIAQWIETQKAESNIILQP